jgi:hypothetical protein
MIQPDYLDVAILDELAQLGSCSLEELNERLPSIHGTRYFRPCTGSSGKAAFPSKVQILSSALLRLHLVDPSKGTR